MLLALLRGCGGNRKRWSTLKDKAKLPDRADKNSTVPAKLPVHSSAAAAQNLGERPERPVRGVYYAVPHRNPHSRGWRTRRHLKRKNLHRSNRNVSQIER